MKQLIILSFFLVLTFSNTVHAQTDKDERKEALQEKKAENKAKAKDKSDYNLFHRQILALKEYSDERRKIPALQKSTKMTVKLAAIVDTTAATDDDPKSKMLTGYIVQNIGDNSTNLYEIVFDRSQQKIVSVKHTSEAIEAEKADKDEDADEKTETKKATSKKTKDDDDDDDDKPVKGKEKEDDKE